MYGTESRIIYRRIIYIIIIIMYDVSVSNNNLWCGARVIFFPFNYSFLNHVSVNFLFFSMIILLIIPNYVLINRQKKFKNIEMISGDLMTMILSKIVF